MSAQPSVKKTAPLAAAVQPTVNGNGFLPKAHLHLEQLEGRWSSEVGINGQRRRRVLEIADGALELSTLDAHGDVCFRARGRLKIVDGEAHADPIPLSNGAELAAGI